ncbi:MAG: sulfatase, partial [Acidobacteriota bacterium]
MASTTRSALHPSRLVLPVLLGSLLAVPTLASPDAAVTEPADILVITVDTVRRDHLSCYGHETLTTPNIDQLAAEGVLWTDCQAAISVTGPSHVTMFTGVYPQVHGAFRNGVKVKPERMTLGELLGAAGYQRQAFVAGWTLKDRVCGLAKGFDTYDDDMDKRYSVVNLMRKADEVTNDALAWFEGEQKRRAKGERDPYFVFVHYFDPHEPYEPVPGPALRPNPQADGGPALEKYDTHLEAYDREIAYTDGEIGRLVDELKKMGLLKDAIIALTADHGQSFGEHGYGGPEG